MPLIIFALQSALPDSDLCAKISLLRNMTCVGDIMNAIKDITKALRSDNWRTHIKRKSAPRGSKGFSDEEKHITNELYKILRGRVTRRRFFGRPRKFLGKLP